MIQIKTDSRGVRTYTFSRCLLDVANLLFPTATDEKTAVRNLLCRLPLDRVETAINIALTQDEASAAIYASRWI